MESFPSVTIGSVKFSRVLIGINSLLGSSHTSLARPLVEALLHHRPNHRCLQPLYRAGTHRRLRPHLASTDRGHRPGGAQIVNMATVKGGAEEVGQQLAMLRDARAAMALVFGHTTDDWPASGGQLIGFPEHVSAIQQAGFHGVVCHDGERLEMVQATHCEDASAYVIPINKSGFYMRPSRDVVLRAVNAADRPIIAIKPLASGQLSTANRRMADVDFRRQGGGGDRRRLHERGGGRRTSLSPGLCYLRRFAAKQVRREDDDRRDARHRWIHLGGRYHQRGRANVAPKSPPPLATAWVVLIAQQSVGFEDALDQRATAPIQLVALLHSTRTADYVVCRSGLA